MDVADVEDGATLESDLSAAAVAKRLGRNPRVAALFDLARLVARKAINSAVRFSAAWLRGGAGALWPDVEAPKLDNRQNLLRLDVH